MRQEEALFGALDTDAQPWVAVTTIVRCLNQGEGLLKWAHRMGMEGKSMEEARAAGQRRGLKGHELLAHLWAGDEIEGEFAPALTDWYRTQRVELEAVERQIRHPKLRYNGRADYLRRVPESVVRQSVPDLARFEQEPWPVIVGDIKTNGRAYLETHLQVDAYGRALLAEGANVWGTEILLLWPGGVWKAIPSAAGPGDFNAVLDCYRAVTALHARL